MIPKNLFQFWGGGRVPSRYVRFRESIQRLNPDWTLKLLGERHAEELSGLPWKTLKEKYWTYAGVSNFARLMAVYRHGGVYLDMDFEGVRPFDSLPTSGAFAAVVDNISEYGAPDRICCAAFGAEAGHPWVKWQIDNLDRVKEKDAAWGVHLMSIAPRDGLTLVPTETFYPWHWDSVSADQKVHPLTVATHWWDGDWRPCA